MLPVRAKALKQPARAYEADRIIRVSKTADALQE